MTTRIKKAGGGNPPATTLEQLPRYQRPALVSRMNRLEQAAEVLLLLQRPLSATSRLGFWALLDRRLRRAYAGVER